MSRVVRVNQGDYIIQAQNGGNIVLDIGATGTVTVTGNMTVVGTSTTISTQNLNVTDNIITINQNETGSGVTLGTSGIDVDRGLLNDATILWNESVNHYDPVLSQNVAGTWVFSLKNDGLTGIQTSTIVNGVSNLVFDMQNSSYVLSVANSPNYSQNVLNSNDIPNRKFVTDYISATGGTANVTNIHYPLILNGGNPQASVTTSATAIDFIINQSLKAEITSAGLKVNNVLLANDSVANAGPNNLVLSAYNNGVELNAVMSLDNIETLTGVYSTSAVSGNTKLYSSATAGPGRTGIYFSNTGNADELMSRRRAVLLSVLL
jgi:hypothetical protein